jgi:hypothetical protein
MRTDHNFYVNSQAKKKVQELSLSMAGQRKEDVSG